MALYRWIKTESRWNKKLISLSSPDWSASLRPIIIIKDIYIAQIREGHKCAVSAEMAVWLCNSMSLELSHTTV